MQFKFQSIVCVFCCLGLQLQAAPAWWSDADYQLIDTARAENDNALVVQGQAKQAFAAAKSYFDNEFVQFGGAGKEINALFQSNWFATSTYDYNVLLNGQLKSLSQPFYLRLDGLGIPLSLVGFGVNYTDTFPWTDNDPTDDADYSPALIGQVKYVYSFDLNLSQDGDTIPDWWEYVFGIDPSVDKDNSSTDSDGDSRLDVLEYAEKTDPTDYYDGTLPSLKLISGNGQQVIAGANAANPIVVRVDNDAIPLSNAPLEVSLATPNSGELGANGVFSGASLSARTDTAGELSIDYRADPEFEGSVTIDFLARSGENQISVQAILNAVKELSLSLFSGVYQTYIHNETSVSGAGQNHSGQLAGRSNGTVDRFSELSGLPSGIKKITTGSDHVLVLTNNGAVYAWGDNFFGQLGLGDFKGRHAPTLIPDLNNVIDVSAGDGFSSFLVDNEDSTTTIYLSGNLQDGIKTDITISNLPILAGQTEHPSATRLAACARHLLILCVDGSVWGWGQNNLGQVNPASTATYISKATRIIETGVSKIATSPDNSLAITDTDELKAWGNTAFDQLNLGILDPSTGIYALAQNIAHATLGNGFIGYLSKSDSLMTAGLNDSGQLGRDTGTQKIASTAVVEREATGAITAIVSGDRHLVYTTEKNELYGFGDNRHGALGAGETAQLAAPVLLTLDQN